MPPAPVRLARERPLAAALLVALVALLVLHLITFVQRPTDAWGYDECTHVQLPAARLVLSEGVGDRLEVVSSCERYPPLVPVYQALVQGVFGLGEPVARGAAFAAWLVGGLLGLAVLGRSLARRLGQPPELTGVLLLLAALSPLVWRFAPTLFLEVPSLVVMAWALVAWLARQGPVGSSSRARELLAGAAVTAAFFTKFNYGLQLGAALALDWLLETVGEVRAGRWREQARRSAWLAAPAFAGFFLWFVIPPGGVAAGESHWQALRSYLGGNFGLAETGHDVRLLNWGLGAFAHPAWFGLALLGLLLTLVRRTVDAHGRVPAPVRCLWLVLLLLALPPVLHPFHLDRLLIPRLLPLWCLAALGLTAVPRRVTLAALVGAAALTLAVPRHAWAGALGLASDDPELRALQARLLDEDLGLHGSVPTSGLPRATHDALADQVAEVVAPGERVVWIGMSSEFPPAVLHLALLARSGDRARFLRDGHEPMDIVNVAGSPPPDLGPRARAQRVGRLLDDADVVLMTAPADLKGRGRPDFQARWMKPVVEAGWTPTQVGRVLVERPGREDLEVLLFAARPGGGG